MILTKCEVCGGEYPVSNKYCPHCATRNRNMMVAEEDDTQVSMYRDGKTQMYDETPGYGNQSGYQQQPPQYGGQQPPVYPGGEHHGGSGINWLVVFIVFMVTLLVTFIVCMFMPIGKQKDNPGKTGPSNGVVHDTVVKEVIVVNTQSQPQPKYVENYLPDGYYSLYGTIQRGSQSADVTFEFRLEDGRIYNAYYDNLKAADGAVQVTMWKSGNTISGEGYDNIGKYFKFYFTASSPTYFTGKLYFGGTIAMNMHLHR